MSEVSAALKELLRRLSERYLLVAGVSGRKTEDAFDLIGLEDVVYSGNHRFEILRDGVRSDEGPPEIVSQADIVVDGVDRRGRGLAAAIYRAYPRIESPAQSLFFARQAKTVTGLRFGDDDGSSAAAVDHGSN